MRLLSISNVLALSKRVISDAFAEANTFVPSSFLRSKYPVTLLPKIKHSIPFQRTLSYRWKALINRGAVFIKWERSPLRDLRLHFLTWRIKYCMGDLLRLPLPLAMANASLIWDFCIPC